MKDKKGQTCCFTGHRIIPKKDLPAIKENLRNAIISAINRGYIFFGAGGAMGFDTLAAQTVIELKKDFPQIKLILVLPCKNHYAKWSAADAAAFKKTLEESDKFLYVSENYFPGCMHKRNRHLADNSSLCISYLTKTCGGTFYTVDYARNAGLEVINIA